MRTSGLVWALERRERGAAAEREGGREFSAHAARELVRLVVGALAQVEVQQQLIGLDFIRGRKEANTKVRTIRVNLLAQHDVADSLLSERREAPPSTQLSV